MAITLRSAVGRPLTFGEVDENFSTLNTGKVSTTGNETIGGIKTFTNGIVADVTGNVTGTAGVAGSLNDGTALTATVAELNTLDGITATTAELNILDGVTATTSELNILDGVTATTAEINKLAGTTITNTQLEYLNGVTSDIQGQIDAKQDILVSGTNIKTINGVNLVGAGNALIPQATGSVAGTVKASVTNGTLYLVF